MVWGSDEAAEAALMSTEWVPLPNTCTIVVPIRRSGFLVGMLVAERESWYVKCQSRSDILHRTKVAITSPPVKPLIVPDVKHCFFFTNTDSAEYTATRGSHRTCDGSVCLFSCMKLRNLGLLHIQSKYLFKHAYKLIHKYISYDPPSLLHLAAGWLS